MKQGSVLSPTISSIILSMVLSAAFTDSIQEVWIKSRPRANLFNASQFKSARKTRNVQARELMFADGTDFMARNYQDVLEITTLCSKSTKAFGRKINLKKTEAL